MHVENDICSHHISVHSDDNNLGFCQQLESTLWTRGARSVPKKNYTTTHPLIQLFYVVRSFKIKPHSDLFSFTENHLTLTLFTHHGHKSSLRLNFR